jgi:hypothetical protein
VASSGFRFPSFALLPARPTSSNTFQCALKYPETQGWPIRTSVPASIRLTCPFGSMMNAVLRCKPSSKLIADS